MKGFLALAFLALPVVADGATLFVRSNSNDVCNGTVDVAGSSGACAKATIQAAVNLATTAGDTVTVHAHATGGTYAAFASAASGISGTLITITGATGETVNITRASISHNFVKLQGFRVTGAGTSSASGITVSGSRNQILSNTILGTSAPTTGGFAVGMTVSGTFNTIASNTWDGVSNGVNTTLLAGINLTGSSADNEVGPNNLFKDFHAIERAFELYGLRNHVFNNEVRNFTYAGEAPHPDIFQTFSVIASRDHIIENNYFHDMDGTQVGNVECDLGPTQTCGDDGVMQNWVFRNNIFANISSIFFIYYPLTFYNNIFYRVGYAWSGNSMDVLVASPYCNAANCLTVRNNAFIASGGNVNSGWYSGTGPKSNNYVAHTLAGAAKSGFSETGGVNGGNPALMAVFNSCLTNVCDFHITTGSVLINAGQTQGTFSVDKDGVARPQGAAWDIGPYELASASGPAAAPTGLQVR